MEGNDPQHRRLALKTNPPSGWLWTLQVSLLFTLIQPLFLYGLLILKGLPPYAMAHWVALLGLVYRLSVIPSLSAGLLLALLLWALRGRWDFFIKPYDFGRTFSIGAIGGALAEALVLAVARGMIRVMFTNVWFAAAVIAGFAAGAIASSVSFKRL